MTLNRYSVKIIFGLMILVLLLFAFPRSVSANSAQPPSIVILVTNPPKDMEVAIFSDDFFETGRHKEVAWEDYYIFYSVSLNSISQYKIVVTTRAKTFEINTDNLEKYTNVFTLDVDNERLVPGEYPLRTTILVGIRLILTLLLEGFILVVFLYKSRKSWVTFLIINLITQLWLNIWLINGSPIIPSYLLFNLIAGELLVFLVEVLGFTILLREHSKRRAFSFAIVANFASLILGAILISMLPV
ncbi:hypothetical protein KHQ82_08995 [Mycoplasmatota bacterium]|nr:hypothetical protein KHQ82_08995 [Mycoplasmatota bacterium]